MDAVQTALRRLIDDAGLFPPGSKPMPKALADHLEARDGPHRMFVGRFLCKVSRLEELAGEVGDGEGWTFGAILDGTGDDWIDSARGDLDRIRASGLASRIDVLELRLPPRIDAPGFVESMAVLRSHECAGELPIFAEVGVDDAAAAVATIASAGDPRLGAKLRCGGLVADAFPDSAAVAAFVETTRRHAVHFKATAGLHHPFRTFDPELGVLQHGFLNLLAAVALVDADPVAVIEERDPGALTLGPIGLSWRNHHADTNALSEARALFTAFGSCSFEEPVEDLLAAGVLSASVQSS